MLKKEVHVLHRAPERREHKDLEGGRVKTYSLFFFNAQRIVHFTDF